MRKAISSVAVGVTLTALLSTSVVVAVSASAATSAVAPAVTAVAPTTQISSTPLTFDRTDGDVLVVTGIDGQPDWLAIGGDFAHVLIPNGVLGCVIPAGCQVAARDFAIVSKSTDAVLYAGNAAADTATDGYVRSITSFQGTIYVGGDFTSFAGSVPPAALPTTLTARTHAFALDSSFNLTAWNPAPTGTVRALAADSGAVYMGGDSTSVLAVDPTTGSTLWTKTQSGGGVHSMLETGGSLYVGGLFETYDGVTQHGLVKVNPSDGSLVTAFNANLRADTGAGTFGAYDGEDIIALSVGPESGQIFAGSGGHAPPGLASNETILTDAATGARVWKYSTTGDSQALAMVGDTVVAGYHNSVGTTTNVFGIQLEDTSSVPTTWDPLLTGSATTDNEDGGNGGVQSMNVDQTTHTLYMAGAFTDFNGGNLVDKSLIAFSFAPPAQPTAPGAPVIGTATAGDTTADLNWTAPYDGGSPITGYTVTSTPGGITATTTTGATSVTVTGLTDGTSYKFKVTATNAVGTSAPSAFSNSVTPSAPTTTSLVATPASPITVGTSVTFTATVTPVAAGKVQFIDGATAMGSPVTVSSGTASLTTSALSQTTHSITAAFTPSNLAFSPSTSTALSFEVDAGGGGGGGGGGLVPASSGAPVRVAGSDRFETALATMNLEFPTAGSAGAVVLARADNYPDALVGTALAAAKNAPLLFVGGGALTPDTQAGIVRVLPAGGTVYLLGGTAAIPDSVATSLTNLGFVVVRYAGTDRYDTALKVAAALGSPSTVFLATGANFPDALSAGPAAASAHGVVLLTSDSTLPAAVKAYLTAHPGTVYAVGGPAVAADPAATPLTGADRYATAIAVANAIFTAPTSVGIASGATFPDALSGGAYQAHVGGPILLTAPTTLPGSTTTYLTNNKTTVATATIFGGSAALSLSVASAIAAALGQ